MGPPRSRPGRHAALLPVHPPPLGDGAALLSCLAHFPQIVTQRDLECVRLAATFPKAACCRFPADSGGGWSLILKTAMSLNRRARTPKEPLVTQSRFTCGVRPSEAPFSMEVPYSAFFVPFCSILAHFLLQTVRVDKTRPLTRGRPGISPAEICWLVGLLACWYVGMLVCWYVYPWVRGSVGPWAFFIPSNFFPIPPPAGPSAAACGRPHPRPSVPPRHPPDRAAPSAPASQNQPFPGPGLTSWDRGSSYEN